MQVWHKDINFEDERGSIRDILTHTPIEHITLIESKAGAVRGNHHHKVTLQYDYVLSGKFKILGRPAGSDVVTAVIAEPGTLVLHDYAEDHAIIALEDSAFLSITQGTRGGESYEQDTYRLSEPLQDPDV